jgi:hypothetical protein
VAAKTKTPAKFAKSKIVTHGLPADSVSIVQWIAAKRKSGDEHAALSFCFYRIIPRIAAGKEISPAN